MSVSDASDDAAARKITFAAAARTEGDALLGRELNAEKAWIASVRRSPSEDVKPLFCFGRRPPCEEQSYYLW